MDEQQSAAWFTARLGKVTASRVKDVMAQTKSGPSASRKNYMMELLCERLTGTRNEGFTSKEMQRGTGLEPVARSAYEIDQGVMTVETGLVLHPSIEGFGASPDALLDGDYVVEFKCPTTTTHISWLLAGVMPEQHKPQVLAQLACTSRTRAVFVSFDPRMPAARQLFIKEWTPTAAEIEAVETSAREFLADLDRMFQQLAEAA